MWPKVWRLPVFIMGKPIRYWYLNALQPSKDENLIPNQFSTGANEKLEKSESEEDQSLHILRVGECF